MADLYIPGFGPDEEDTLRPTPAWKRARGTDPETSHEAAHAVTPKMRENQKQIMELMRAIGRPVRDEELVDAAPEHGIVQKPSGIRTRRHELVEFGLVHCVGKEKGWTGSMMKVWAPIDTEVN